MVRASTPVTRTFRDRAGQEALRREVLHRVIRHQASTHRGDRRGRRRSSGRMAALHLRDPEEWEGPCGPGHRTN